MRVLLVPDAFKDSLSAGKVAMAMKKAILKRFPDATVVEMAASDGGEGFLDTVAAHKPAAEKIRHLTVDPLGRPVEAPYLFDRESGSAYIELAQASGLELLEKSERNPLNTSTYGTGLQLKDALIQGANKVYVGLGGSATNDGGTGIAAALGYNFFDRAGKDLRPVGKNLTEIRSITVIKPSTGITFFAINDVLNPLYGAEGAAFTYARQKGADPEEIELLDKGLRNLAQRVKEQLHVDVAGMPGSGAAGGTAFGLKAFLNAEFIPGIQFMFELSGLQRRLQEEKFDLIITGEGSIDRQTPYGKLVSGVAREGKNCGIPVMAVCGKLDLEEKDWRSMGLFAIAQLYEPGRPPGYSFDHAYQLIIDRTEALLKHYRPSTQG